MSDINAKLDESARNMMLVKSMASFSYIAESYWYGNRMIRDGQYAIDHGDTIFTHSSRRS